MYTAQHFQKKQPVINHIHWDGSIPPEALFEFYSRKGIFPTTPKKDIFGNSVVEQPIDSPEKLANFQQELLTKWDIVDVFKVSIRAMSTANDLINAAKAHCHYLQSQGIKYAETRFAPAYHLNPRRGLFGLDEVIENALLGFHLGEQETGVKTELIICINREIDQYYLAGKSLVNSIDVVKAAIKFSEAGVAGKKIAGIDLAGYEPLSPPDDFVSAYRLTLDTPLKRTIHVGEMMGSDEANLRNIRYAVEHLQLDGLGDALPLCKDYQLMETIAKKGIRLESNPRSNLHCQFIADVTELGLDILMENGVKVTINPDDPFLWPQGHLADNLALVANSYGLELVNLAIRNSIETAWKLSEAEKQELNRGL